MNIKDYPLTQKLIIDNQGHIQLRLGAYEKIRYQSIRNNGYIPFG